MSQSRHNPSSKQNPDLLTDCASAGVGSRVNYGYEKSRNNPEDQCYSKSHMLASSGIISRDIPSSPTDKCLYESQDSGFLSGAINSEQSICSSDDLSSSTASKNKIYSGDLGDKSNIRDKNYTDSGYLEETNSMRLDSEYELNEQFSELNLKKSHLNDLNASSCGSITATTTPAVPEPSSYQITPPSAPASNDSQQQQSSQVEFDPLLQYYGQDEHGDTQLHLAILEGFIEVVYAIIRLAPDPCLLDIPNDSRYTPLHLAVLTAQAPIVRALLVAGASPDSKDRNGNTALHLASDRGYIDSVRALLQPVSVAETSSSGLRYSMAGAAPGPSCLEERNYDGQLCVHLAAAGGHVDVLRHLVWFGADVNARESKCGRTALHVAAERGNHQVSKYLLSQECQNSVDLHLTTYSGYTAYQLAYYADQALAHELASRGAALAHSDTEEDSEDDDDEMLFTHLPGEGFYWGLNGAINQQAISA